MQIIMSRSAPNKKPNIDVLFLENVPSLSKIAGHKAIEQNEGMNVVFMTLMYMTTVCKLRNNENNTATAEEINTWTKEIAMRICQKHIGTEILENIHSLKRSVEKLSVSCLYYFLLLIIIATFLYVLYIAS
jgi:hypothetical protein